MCVCVAALHGPGTYDERALVGKDAVSKWRQHLSMLNLARRAAPFYLPYKTTGLFGVSSVVTDNNIDNYMWYTLWNMVSPHPPGRLFFCRMFRLFFANSDTLDRFSWVGWEKCPGTEKRPFFLRDFCPAFDVLPPPPERDAYKFATDSRPLHGENPSGPSA